MENITNNILNNFNNISPLLLAYFRHNKTLSLLISLFPYKIKIMCYLLNIYLKKHMINNNYKCYIKLDNCPKLELDQNKMIQNMDNIAVSWWILENQKITKLTNIKYINYFAFKHNIKFIKNFEIVLNNLNSLNFEFNKIKYLITTDQTENEKNSNQSIYIYSDTIENCDYLINNAVIEYKKHIQNILKEKILIYKLNSQSSYQSDNYIELKIKKNKNNTFLEKNISEIYNKIEYFFSNESKQFKLKNALPNKLSILLYGIPGSGKTTLIYTIANLYKLNIFKLQLNDIKTNQDFESIIYKISEKSLVVIEEIDCCNWCKKRELKEIDNKKNDNKKLKDIGFLFGESTNKNSEITLDTLLNYLEGYEHLNECIIMITSNHPDHLDPALLRPGRIDLKYEFTYLSIELMNKITQYFINYELTSNDIEKLKDKNISLAQLTNVILMELSNQTKDNNPSEIIKKIIDIK